MRERQATLVLCSKLAALVPYVSHTLHALLNSPDHALARCDDNTQQNLCALRALLRAQHARDSAEAAAGPVAPQGKVRIILSQKAVQAEQRMAALSVGAARPLRRPPPASAPGRACAACAPPPSC